MLKGLPLSAGVLALLLAGLSSGACIPQDTTSTNTGPQVGSVPPIPPPPAAPPAVAPPPAAPPSVAPPPAVDPPAPPAQPPVVAPPPDPGQPLPPPVDPGRGNGRGNGNGGNNNDEFEALLVVGNADVPAAGDDDLVDTIEDLLNGDDEIDTDVADDEDDADDVEEDFDAVLISSSVDDNVVDDEYADVEIMVVVMDDETQPNMEMTEDQVNQDFGVNNDTEIEIEDENNEIAEAADLEEDDNIEVAANNVAMAFGDPDNDAEIVAVRQGTNDEAVLYTYDSGDEMANEEEAEGDRLFFFLQEQNVNDLNGDGDDLLEAVLLFAITGDAEGP